MSKEPLDYRSAGVDIDAGNALVDRIKSSAKRTTRPGVLGGLGGFGGLFELPWDRYKQPVLVSGTDGVGTKLKLAIDSGQHQGIGIDLVAMCVNDLIVCGAEPLFFLDYYATGKLELTTAETIIASIAEGCVQSGMALVGGETAEMPGMYAEGDYDLAGFAVGIVEKAEIISGEKVAAGDALLAIESSGPHANGFSLIRKVLETRGIDPQREQLDDKSLMEHLLAPTSIYVKAIEALKGCCDIHALAHITGGGLLENLPRVLPENTKAVIDTTSWQWPSIFNFLQSEGNIAVDEMFRTFNCGVGMVVCLPQAELSAAIEVLSKAGFNSWKIGQIEGDETVSARVVFK